MILQRNITKDALVLEENWYIFVLTEDEHRLLYEPEPY